MEFASCVISNEFTWTLAEAEAVGVSERSQTSWSAATFELRKLHNIATDIHQFDLQLHDTEALGSKSIGS